MTEDQIKEMLDIVRHMINTKARHGYPMGPVIEDRIEALCARVAGRSTAEVAEQPEKKVCASNAFHAGYSKGVAAERARWLAKADDFADEEIPF